jgi:ankyrin repeat protein
MAASARNRLEVVRVLLGYPNAKVTIDYRRPATGWTALFLACKSGHGGIVMALLEEGADPTIAADYGTTPMAIAQQEPHDDDDQVSAEDRRECVAALEVRSPSPLSLP